MDISIGAGIAIAGIWLGVGIVGWKEGWAAVILGLFAMMATAAVAGAM